MNKFVQSFLQELDEGRLRAILAILRKGQEEGVIKTRREFDFMLDRLLTQNRIDAYQKSFVPVYPNPNNPISSEEFNTNFSSVYKDLYALYTHVGGLSVLTDQHDRVLESELNVARDSVRKLLEDVSIFRFKKANPGWNEVKYNTFTTGRNLTPKASKASVDPRITQLTLPIGSTVTYTDDRGDNGPSIEITNLSQGSTEYSCAQFKPENALDSLESTFWGEALLSDEVVKTSYNGEDYQGAIFEALITFQNVKRINTIEILPFGSFPVKILDITISDDGETYTQWQGYEDLDASIDWLVYRSIATNSKYVKIIFLQENYRKVSYLIPEELIERVDTWENILNDKLSRADELGNLAPYDERNRQLNREYNSVLDAQIKLDSDLLKRELHKGSRMPEQNHAQLAQGISSVMLGKYEKVPASITTPLPGEHTPTLEQSKLVEIKKYEYVLGAYDIKVLYNEYPREASYMSQQYASQGSIVTARLYTVEDHEIVDSRRLTSVEYTLHLAENMSMPIMPYGTERIYNERVYVDRSSMIGSTRFTPSTSPNVVVMFNNTELEEDVDYTIDANGKLSLIGFELYMIRMPYVTVSYDVDYPTDDFSIDSTFSVQLLEDALTFPGTNSRGHLELPYPPYLHRTVFISDAWERPNKKEGVWYPRRSAGPQLLEGNWYGTANGFVSSYNTTTHKITLTDEKGNTLTYTADQLGFPSEAQGEYKVRVGDSICTAETSSGLIEITESGLEGSAKYDLDTTDITADMPIELLAFRAYEPIHVDIGGNKARNITSYVSDAQEAFAYINQAETNYEYLQIGRNLYFNKPVTKEIKVQYYHKAKYAQLEATLRSSDGNETWVTPSIHSYRLALKTVKR